MSKLDLSEVGLRDRAAWEERAISCRSMTAPR